MVTPDGVSYGDRQPRPATVSSATITAINSEHSARVRSSIDLRSACAPAGQQLPANLPRRRAGWTGSLRSRFRNLSPTLCTYERDIGANEPGFILSTMLTLFDLYWPHGTFCAHWLWGALDRGDGRKLDTSLCMECSTDSYDTGEPSIAIRDPRGRPTPRGAFECPDSYGRLRRETPGWVKG